MRVLSQICWSDILSQSFVIEKAMSFLCCPLCSRSLPSINLQSLLNPSNLTQNQPHVIIDFLPGAATTCSPWSKGRQEMLWTRVQGVMGKLPECYGIWCEDV